MRIKEEILTAIKNELKPGQKFRFHCTQCGECCRNWKGIFLAPYDLFRIAKYLGMKPSEVMQRYCTLEMDSGSMLPAAALSPEDEGGACPFLKGNVCSIQPVKPDACALYPLGRVVEYTPKDDSTGNKEKREFYCLQEVNCGTREEAYTAEEWFADCGMNDGGAWFQEWVAALEKLIPLMNFVERFLSEKRKNELRSMFVVFLYWRYHTDEDFMPQFQRNLGTVLEMLS